MKFDSLSTHESNIWIIITRPYKGQKYIYDLKKMQNFVLNQ